MTDLFQWLATKIRNLFSLGSTLRRMFPAQSYVLVVLILVMVVVMMQDRLPHELVVPFEGFVGVIVLHLAATMVAQREIIEKFRGEVDRIGGQLSALVSEKTDALDANAELRTTAERTATSSMRSAGIEKISATRAELTVEIVSAIRNAEKEVLMIGVALHDTLNRQNLAPLLARKCDAGVGVRLLLLDPVRTAAVFRSIVETQPHRVLDALSFRKTDHSRDKHPYFDLPLYNRFTQSFKKIEDNPGLKNRVRYYGTSPLCWMIVADDTVFYKPYVYSRTKQQREGHDKAFDPMPVLVCRRTSEEGKALCQHLIEHFNVVWASSLVTHDMMAARKVGARHFIQQLFDDRSYQLRQILAGLQSDQRKSPRERCLPPFLQLQVSWTDNTLGSTESRSADLMEYNADAIALKFEGIAPALGSSLQVALPSDPNASGDIRTSAAFVARVFSGANYSFVATRNQQSEGCVICLSQR